MDGPAGLTGFPHGLAEASHLPSVSMQPCMVPFAVSREDPFDLEFCKPVHAFGENFPRVPGLLGKNVELVVPAIPVEGIAGEQPFVVDMQDGMSSRVAGNRNGKRTRGNFGGVCAGHDVGGKRSGVRVGFVDPDAGIVAVGPLCGISHVVTVCEKNVRDPAQGVDVLGEGTMEDRRVNEDVPAGGGAGGLGGLRSRGRPGGWCPDDQIRMGTEGTWCIVAGCVDPWCELVGKRRFGGTPDLHIANGLGGACLGSPPEGGFFVRVCRLAGYKGPSLLVRSDQSGRPVPGDVTADATGVNKPGSRNIRWMALVFASHACPFDSFLLCKCFLLAKPE